MADIRINALATTATTPASDDYLALDGAAQGTRKILATNIANNVTDVILGASGPSVKSTLSARAPRQGLVFDGTGAATVTTASIGTTDFTLAAWVNPVDWADRYIFGIGASYDGLYVNDGTGELFFFNGANVVSGLIIPIGKTSLVTVRRSSGTLYFGLNGIETAGVAMGTSLGAVTKIGDAGAGGYRWNGTLSGSLVYNRALSASEVVALYEAGAPSGADYNSASNTAINTSAWTNYLSTYTSFTGASATGFTAVKASGAAYAAISPTPTTAKGQKFRVTGTLTLNNGKTVLPTVYVDSGGTGAVLSAGAFSVTIEAATAGSTLIIVTTTGDADYTLSNLSVTRLGLLLAPDAAQAGGGLVWYDTSGNAANITLPASGVSWNVPSSRYLGGNWTTSGNLTVSGTGNSTFAGNVVSKNTAILFGDGADNSASLYSTGGAVKFWANATEAARIFSNGNLFIGASPVDSSNGKLQLATHTTSAGGIGFGTDTSLYRTEVGRLGLGHTSLPLFQLDISGNKRLQLAYVNGTTTGILATTVAGASLVLQSGNEATALTLDSSQSAKFANQVAANNGSLLVYYNSGSARISPSLIADVSSTATSTSGLAPALLIRNRGTATQNQWARIGFAAGSAALSATDGIIGAEISAQFVGTVASGNTRSTDIVFGTADQTVAQEPIERMRIKYNGRINFASLPTSSAGLAAGDIWNDGGTLKIV